MIEGDGIALYLSMLVAGLAGSLHCVGMCGPILLGFSKVFEAADGKHEASRWRMDFAWYHAGRIWTYGVLGYLAGLAGLQLRESAAHLGWQQPVAIGLGVTVIVTGIILSGLVPGLRLDAFVSGCGISRIRGWNWFRSLLEGPGRLPRLLLGATMGLLPCGLVYAMLVVVAAMSSPVHAALGMLAFGIGTVPSLSAVILLERWFPTRVRRLGTRFAAVALIAVGCLMLARAALITAPESCPLHGELTSSAIHPQTPSTR